MKKNLPLAILSGLLLWIAWPPSSQYLTGFLFIGLVPMLLAIENIIKGDSAKKGRLVFNTAFIGFLIWNTLSVYWVYNALKSIGELVAIPITLIPYSLGPLLMATAFWLYYRLRLVAPRWVALIGLVCFWVGYEYLHQSWDLNFPWMTLGNGLAVAHQWVQWYEYTGVYGGTVWIWAVNIISFLIYLDIRGEQKSTVRIGHAIALFVVFLGPALYSWVVYSNYVEEQNPSNVVVAQPNIDPYEKEGSIPANLQVDVLIHLSRQIAQPNTEYFIWPETAIPDYIDEDKLRSSNLISQARFFLRNYKNANLITGAETYKMYDTRATETAKPFPEGGFYDSYNTALSIENGDRLQTYHKSRLVPGAESLPFGNALSFMKPVFEHLGGATGTYAPDKDAGVFYSQSGIGVAPSICFESIWGGYVARSVAKGAQFIAIITNDGWWENTSGKDQHLDYAKLRAIETRRWVCRSANTGISAFINQRGDIVKHTEWWTKTAIKQDINLNSEITFYVKHGDYIPQAGSVLAGVGILFLLGMRLRRKRVLAA